MAQVDWLASTRAHGLVLVDLGTPEASPGLIKWGDWGWATRVELAYTHPRTGALMTIEELVRVTDPDGWTLRLGEADVSCWGVLPSGRLQHPVFVSD
jgi:hypothetical protein